MLLRVPAAPAGARRLCRDPSLHHPMIPRAARSCPILGNRLRGGQLPPLTGTGSGPRRRLQSSPRPRKGYVLVANTARLPPYRAGNGIMSSIRIIRKPVAGLIFRLVIFCMASAK